MVIKKNYYWQKTCEMHGCTKNRQNVKQAKYRLNTIDFLWKKSLELKEVEEKRLVCDKYQLNTSDSCCKLFILVQRE